MKKFLGLIFVTGIVRKPKLELYWSTRGIFRTPIFQQTMSRNRFQLIQRYLHFNDNNAAGTNKDRLYRYHHLTSRKARAEHLLPPTKHVPKNDPPGRLDGKLKNHKLVNILHIKNDKTPNTKMSNVRAKYIKKETRFLCAQCGVPLHPEGCYTRYHTLK
jgi:hypothetical protein